MQSTDLLSLCNMKHRLQCKKKNEEALMTMTLLYANGSRHNNASTYKIVVGKNSDTLKTGDVNAKN